MAEGPLPPQERTFRQLLDDLPEFVAPTPPHPGRTSTRPTIRFCCSPMMPSRSRRDPKTSLEPNFAPKTLDVHLSSGISNFKPFIFFFRPAPLPGSPSPLPSPPPNPFTSFRSVTRIRPPLPVLTEVWAGWGHWESKNEVLSSRTSVVGVCPSNRCAILRKATVLWPPLAKGREKNHPFPISNF